MLFAPQIANLLIGDLQGGNTIEDVSFAIRCVSFAILVVPFLSVAKGYLQGHKIINVSSVSQIIEQVVRIGIILGGVYLAFHDYFIGFEPGEDRKKHIIANCKAVRFEIE